jgi:malate dehydrogenase (oxaloacetate-decarboxylating)
VELSTQQRPDEGLDYRRRYRGLIGVNSKVPIRDRAILSLVYTPGVAEACLATTSDGTGR